MAIVNQNIIIEITKDSETRSGVSNTTGNAYEIVTQEAYYHSPVEKYPQKINFPVESDQKSYQQGYYLLDTSNSLNVGQFNSLGFHRYMSLISLSEQDLKQLINNKESA